MVTNSEATARLLAQAFGRRLLEGDGEWRGVESVVRSSFWLLASELRRQGEQLDQLHKEPEPVEAGTAMALLEEQLTLVREELRLTQAELRQLRETPPQCNCHGLVRQYAHVVASRHAKLQRRVATVERRVSRTRRAQHECEEIVVRTAEQHARRLQKVQRQVDSLRAQLSHEVQTKRTLLDKHVAATHAQQPRQEQAPEVDYAVVVESQERKSASEKERSTWFLKTCKRHCPTRHDPLVLTSRFRNETYKQWATTITTTLKTARMHYYKKKKKTAG